MEKPTKYPLDYEGVKFAQILVQLESHPPLTEKYMRLYDKRELKIFTSQRAHMSKWFSQLYAGGGYGRKYPSTAKQAYNRLQSPAGLLWIGEALGEDYSTLVRAFTSAGGRGHKAHQSAKIRQHIPWPRVCELIALNGLSPDGWANQP